MTGELCAHEWEPIDHCLGIRWQCRWCFELAFELPGTPAAAPSDEGRKAES